MSPRTVTAMLASAAVVAAAPAVAGAVTPPTPSFLEGTTSQGGEVALTVNVSMRLQTLRVFYSCAPGEAPSRETKDVYKLGRSKWPRVSKSGRFSKTLSLPSYSATLPGQLNPERGSERFASKLKISGRWVTKRRVKGSFRVTGGGCDTGRVTFDLRRR